MGPEPFDRHPRGSQDDDSGFAAIMAWLETGARSDALDREEALDAARFSARVALARALRQRLAEAALPALSAVARARALGLAARAGGSFAEALPRAGEAIARVWRTLRARLAPEGPEVAPAFRSRATGATPAGESGRAGPFLVLYAADGYDIDVSLSERGTLIGQVLPVTDAAPFDGGRCTVVPLIGHSAPRSVAIGVDGEFIVAGPHAAAIEVVLEREDSPGGPVRIVIDRIELAGGAADPPHDLRSEGPRNDGPRSDVEPAP